MQVPPSEMCVRVCVCVWVCGCGCGWYSFGYRSVLDYSLVMRKSQIPLWKGMDLICLSQKRSRQLGVIIIWSAWGVALRLGHARKDPAVRTGESGSAGLNRLFQGQCVCVCECVCVFVSVSPPDPSWRTQRTGWALWVPLLLFSPTLSSVCPSGSTLK